MVRKRISYFLINTNPFFDIIEVSNKKLTMYQTLKHDDIKFTVKVQNMDYIIKEFQKLADLLHESNNYNFEEMKRIDDSGYGNDYCCY